MFLVLLIEMGDRNYQDALKILDALPVDSAGIQESYVHKDLVHAEIYHELGEVSLMKFHAESVRLTLEKLVREHPRFMRLLE